MSAESTFFMYKKADMEVMKLDYITVLSRKRSLFYSKLYLLSSIAA